MSSVFLNFMFFYCASLAAQTAPTFSPDTLVYKHGKYWHGGIKLNEKALKTQLIQVDEAYSFYQKSRTNALLVGISSIAAIPCIMLHRKKSTIYDISSKKPRNGFLAAAIALEGFAIYELTRFIKNRKTAARIYNQKRVSTY